MIEIYSTNTHLEILSQSFDFVLNEAETAHLSKAMYDVGHDDVFFVRISFLLLCLFIIW